MERKVDNRTILDKFVEDFCSIIEKHCKYIICSGFVAIAHGRTRGTEDIDMILEKLSKEDFLKLHDNLINSGFKCMQSDSGEIIYDLYLDKGNSVRYVRKSDSYAPPEMEIKFPKDELDIKQINERVKLPLTQLDISFSSIESNIAFKEEYLGTEKDMEDAKHLRIVYQGEFDEKKVEDIKEEIRRLRK